MNNNAILLVEDNPSDIELTKRAFEKGHIANDLIVLEDGQDAIDFIFCKNKYANRDENQLLSLVLLDLKLPKVEGLEVLRAIRTAEKNIKRLPVIILTSSKEEQDVAASYDLGVNSYIRKPVDFKQFADAIKHLGLYWLVINEPPPLL